MFRAILYLLFPGEEGRDLDNQFVREFPDAKPFFKGRLDGFRAITTANDLTPYHRYELWKYISDISPRKDSTP